MLNLTGWSATAVFPASYWFRQPAALGRIQAVAANAIVAAAALFFSRRDRPAGLSSRHPLPADYVPGPMGGKIGPVPGQGVKMPPAVSPHGQ
jgi:hypothetical protein